MANKKISELTQANVINSNDILPIVQSGETKKLNFETITKTILNTAFPIGKVEVFFDNDDHSNYLGFEWERTAIGKTPVGIDESDTDFNTIGKTGGEKKHTLTIDEMPKHSHSYACDQTVGSDTTGLKTGIQTLYYNNTSASGGDQPHNNLQPYEVMAFWKRVR